MNTRMLVVGLAITGLAAACGSGSSGGSSGAVADTTPTSSPTVTATATATATPTVTTTTTVTPTPTVTDTVTAAPVVARCLSRHLQLSLGDGDGAAGTTYQSIVFTNTGSTACHLHGYPGVSFVNAAGKIIGKPATMDTGTIKTITLAAGGGQAHAELRQPDAGNFDPSACHITTADRLQVYPPGETVQLFTSDTAQVCSTSAGRAGVSPVEAGAGS